MRNVLVILCLMCICNLFAESIFAPSDSLSLTEQRWRMAFDSVPKRPINYVGMHLRAGYNNWYLNKEDICSPGGAGVGFGFSYKMEYRALRFTLGAEADYVSNSMRGSFTTEKQVIKPSTTMTYITQYNNINSYQHALEVAMPIMIGANYRGYYMQIGTILVMPVYTSYQFQSDVERIIYDYHTIDPFSGMPNHELYTDQLSQKGTLSLGFSPRIAAEVGFNLDQWLAYHPKARKGKARKVNPFTRPSNKELWHYEAGIFAHVGCMDYRKNPDIITDARMIPWTIGVKMSFFYEVYKGPKKPRKPKKPKETKTELVTQEIIQEEIPEMEQDTIATYVFQGDTVRSGESVILQNIYFASDETNILPSSQPALDALFDLLDQNPTVSIQIIGHTDNTNTAEYNMRLSKGRAKSIRTAMIRRGIDPQRMEIIGKGLTEPVADNKTAAGRAKNRRVEIVIAE